MGEPGAQSEHQHSNVLLVNKHKHSSPAPGAWLLLLKPHSAAQPQGSALRYAAGLSTL
jgi:hypothetical protein